MAHLLLGPRPWLHLPRPVARLRSSASQLLWRSSTSPARSSSATAPRLPDAIRRRIRAPDGQETSRFPRKELERMPGSKTTPGQTVPALGSRRFVLPSDAGTSSAPGITCLSRLNGWPTPPPADASPPTSRSTPHGSGRCGARNLHRKGLSPHTPCRSPAPPANRANRFPPLSSDCTNPLSFIWLSGFARVEGKDGAGRLSPLLGR